ncbi:MAG: hypothetical protein NZ742_02065 [Acidobacteria bacterium]|nr:hypothetical protein [Acidobacteriota bacterium]MDW7983620.1 hypothetical protein [Acidobacteriota bacterium]
MRLRERNQRNGPCIVFYELIPPPRDATPREIEAVVECVAEFIASLPVPIDALNIPEVRPESSREPQRPQAFVPKMEPREFVRWVRKVLPPHVDVVINRCIVYAPREAQLRWLVRTYHEFQIENLILVGGESSQIRYPGPSVLETAEWITEHLNRGRWPFDSSKPPIRPTDFFLGGITIPTRRKPDPERDEPARLIQKARRGLQFFTSQVLYEPVSMQKLLQDYMARCQAEGIPPRRVFLSFAPVSSSGDVQFLKWLGVEIPPHVEQELLQGWLGVAWRSIRVAERVLQEILDFVTAERISVPLGLNVEHITSRNFEISAEMIARLVAVFQRHLRQEALADTAAEWALQLAGLPVPDG